MVDTARLVSSLSWRVSGRLPVLAPTGAGRDGRAIGLLAAITAVLLVGLLLTLGRLLLAHRHASRRRR